MDIALNQYYIELEQLQKEFYEVCRTELLLKYQEESIKENEQNVTKQG